MTQRVEIVVIVFLSAGLLFAAVVPAQQADLPAGRQDRRSEVVRALLQHERPLTGAHVEIPASLYHRYLRDLHALERPGADAPIPFIAESGTYHLAVGAEGQTTLKAEVRLRVLDPMRTRNFPVLSAKAAWEDLAVNDKPVKLATVGDWLRFTSPPAGGPLGAGLYTITARLRLETTGGAGGTVSLNIPETIKTFVVFDSPAAWEVQTGQEQFPHLIGTVGKGTHGRLALTPGKKLLVEYHPPMPLRDRPPQYSLQGDVAWNLDAGAQQITASLTATIASGASDQIVLLLPDGADRVEITGPEVRKVQAGAGRAVVYLRGKILGQTVLKVSCELPAGKGSKRRFDRFGAAEGRWTGGTLVITNSAGGSEVIPETMTGLREMSPAEIPPSASAILPAPAVMAYEITSRAFSAEVEVLQLGEFALRQSIADLAHYEVFLARDGSVICRARYEIRNSNKQFLSLKLPAGAQVLLARVNEKSRPISPRTTGETPVKKGNTSKTPVKKGNTGETPVVHSEWLLPLERSRASVMGLVSFPVEVVFLCRTVPMGEGGVAEIPLPAIDLPIAYGWCETYVPDGMEVKQWSGAMRKVVRFSSETATASLDYGWGEMAEGYTRKDRPPVPPTPIVQPADMPAASRPSSQPSVPIISKVTDLTPSGWVSGGATYEVPTASILAKNYYRAGKDYYDQADYSNASRYLEQVAKLAPGSSEARNAERLLANPQMPKAMKLSTGAEKAAARVVEREVAEQRRPLEQQQEKLLEEAIEDTRKGKTSEAKAKFATVKVLREELLARHGDVKQQQAMMQKAEPELQKLRKQTADEVSKLRKQMSELKKVGKYKGALETAGKLQRTLAGSGVYETYGRDEMGRATMAERESSSAVRLAARSRLESEKLQKEMDALAAAASLERQRKGEGTPRPDATVSRLPSRKVAETVTRVYDIRDLVLRMPDFKGPKVSLRPAGNNAANNNAAGWAWGDDEDSDKEDAPSRQELTGQIVELIRSTIATDTWGEDGGKRASIRETGGQIIVTQTAENQRALTDLLVQLRQSRGPQVEEGEKIARQKAGGKTLDDVQVDFLKKATAHADRSARAVTAPRLIFYNGQAVYVVDRDGALETVRIEDKELDEFIRWNYKWALEGRTQGNRTTTVTVPDGGTLLLGGQRVNVSGLVSKLRFNLGQKVTVNSLNVNADARAAEALGVQFNRGGNNVNWAVINEAQFRSLMELDAELTRRSGRAVAANERLQETIVGTDARLSNEMTANIAFAGDKGNALDISGNAINLSHEGYLLLYNGRHLTVVRAGAMQHWQERPVVVQFAEIPQNIEAPRVGQLFRFERTLLEPSDQMVLRAEYKMKK